MRSSVGQVSTARRALSTGREDVAPPGPLRKYTPPVVEMRSTPMDWKGLTDEKRAAARTEFQRIFQR